MHLVKLSPLMLALELPSIRSGFLLARTYSDFHTLQEHRTDRADDRSHSTRSNLAGLTTGLRKRWARTSTRSAAGRASRRHSRSRQESRLRDTAGAVPVVAVRLARGGRNGVIVVVVVVLVIIIVGVRR